jgi:teichuronic acid biosynthesis glycosyltransferase TuaG
MHLMSDWKHGLVSVVMPAYNSQGSLAQSVRSVLQQTYPNWELLIIDDASSDETLPLANQFAHDDERIHVISTRHNGGVADARNIGIGAAKGQYLAFLDSDDLWLPEKLKVQVSFMQSRNAAFSFTQYRRFGPGGMRGGPIKIPERVNYTQLLRGNVIGCLTVMIDREKVTVVSMPKVGHEDYAAWLRVLKHGIVAWGIQEDLARYRISSQSVSADKRHSAKWTWNIYRRIEKLSLLRSIWCFTNYSMRAILVRFVS